jgi:hypothetical protein
MKKLNQKGFSGAVVLTALLAIILVVWAGYYVYQNQKNDDSEVVNRDTTQVNDTDPVVIEVNLLLKATGDLDELPPITPQSFKVFMQEKLSNNIPDENGCIPAYNITKISKVNIEGGSYAVKASGDTDSDECGSGAPALWVLAPNGEWDQVGRNANTTCESANGGLVYEEFAPDCYTDKDLKTLVKNPNGSITELGN